MKYCTRCGNEIGETDTFCSICGAPVEKEDAVVTNNSYSNTTNNNQKVNYQSDSNNKIYATLCIIFGSLGGWLGLIFGIIGLMKDKERKYTIRYCIGLGLWTCWMVLYILVLFS